MELSVGDVMTRAVIYVKPTQNIKKVAELMKIHDIDSLLVMENKKGVGIVTDTDIIRKVVAEGIDPSNAHVGDIMTSPLVTINPEADIDEAAKEMSKQHIKRLVVTKRNNIVGIISEDDIVNVEPALSTLIREHNMWSIEEVTPIPESLSGVCESCNNYSEDLKIRDGRLLCEECVAQV
ncbi:MAG: hypothetical protein B6U97_03565 [Candidatus Altiarchaeales archaeon ex4484_96]|nr:MAG: hypothetical protein B6U97_03565 [Candidatus Altiarchaeales archaeon ex4484_96]